MPMDLPPPPPMETPPDVPTTSTAPNDDSQDSPVQGLPDDITARVDAIDQAAEAATYAMLRAQYRPVQETPAEYNERVKREFTEKVMEARRQANQPPPPPQPVARGISEQTAREMAAGAKQSAYWAEQQKHRPAPSARDRQAAGQMVEVFSPDRYTHEKGEGIKGKGYSASSLPGR